MKPNGQKGHGNARAGSAQATAHSVSVEVSPRASRSWRASSELASLVASTGIAALSRADLKGLASPSASSSLTKGYDDYPMSPIPVGGAGRLLVSSYRLTSVE